MFRVLSRVVRSFSSQQAAIKIEATPMGRWFNGSTAQIISIVRDYVGLDKDTTIIGLPFDLSPEAIEQSQFRETFDKIGQNNSPVIVKCASGANLGINRNFTLKNLQKTLFSGIHFHDENSQLNKNPQWPASYEELTILKPLLLEQFKDSSQNQSQKIISTLQKKLIQQYEVEGDYVDFIIKAIVTSDVDVYLNGLSELVFRKAIAFNYPLETIKQKFVDYVQQCKKLNNFQELNVGKTFLKTVFQDTLVPLEDRFLYLTQSRIKGQKLIVCDTYNIPGLQTLKSSQTIEDLKKISSVRLYKPFIDPVKSPAVQPENDEMMIQKHAILECMISDDLWTQPYITNMFPYISQNFLQLSEGEQQTIKQRYRFHLNRYRAVRNKLLHM